MSVQPAHLIYKGSSKYPRTRKYSVRATLVPVDGYTDWVNRARAKSAKTIINHRKTAIDDAVLELVRKIFRADVHKSILCLQVKDGTIRVMLNSFHSGHGVDKIIRDALASHLSWPDATVVGQKLDEAYAKSA